MAISKGEIYAALAAILPFAEIEVDCMASYLRDFGPDDELTDPERTRQGVEAVQNAKTILERCGKMNLSDEERARRSKRMADYWAAKRATQEAK